MKNMSAADQKRQTKLRLWLVIFFVGLLFTVLLWDHYFNSAYAIDRAVVSNLVLVMGILLSFTVALFSWSIERGRDYLEREIVKRTEDLLKRNQELEKALAEIKELRGLIPICASCKKVRNDQGYWQQIELYLEEHSDAKFTHGLCKECAGKLYQEFYQKKVSAAGDSNAPS